MTTPIDSLTPLVLRSELTERMSADKKDARLLGLIVEQSQIFQEACSRRFDEFVEPRYFTPMHLSVGGDLFGLRDLRLDMDLKSAPANTTVTNGDGSAIAASLMKFEPLNSQYKRSIRLNPFGIQFWNHSGVTDPRGSIGVTGTWGYGGQWINPGAGTLASGVSGVSDTAMVVADGTQLEVGMVLNLTTASGATEYLYVTTVPNTAIGSVTVQRGFNGSTPVAHLAGETVLRWQSNQAVRQYVTRLVQIALELDKSPLYGQIVMGDSTFPITAVNWPDDVVKGVRINKLKRTPRIQGI